MVRSRLIAVVWIEAAIIVALAAVIAWITFLNRPITLEPTRRVDLTAGGVDTDLAASPSSRSARQATESQPAAPVTGMPYVEEPEAVLKPDDPLGIMLYGTLTRADGKPMQKDASVALVQYDTSEWRSSGGIKNTTGAYAITGLTPGTWNLLVRERGFREIDRPIELSPAHPRQRLDVVLEPAIAIQVKFVTPDGQLLNDALRAEKFEMFVGVSAVATTTAPSGDLPVTEMAGHWDYGAGVFRGSGDGVPKGWSVLELREGPPVYVSAVLRHVVLETKLVAAATEEVVFTISTDAVKRRLAAVKLKLVDAEDGSPIAKARVDVSDRQSGGPGYTTEEDGTLAKDGIRPGLMVLSIEREGFERFSRMIRLEAGQTTDLGVIQLAKAATIEGIVVDERGAPAQANVFYRNIERIDPSQPMDLPMTHNTDADGTFKIGYAGRGRGFLTATTADSKLSGALRVDTTTGSAAGIRLSLRPCTPVVLDMQIPRDTRYYVAITDDAGTPWYGRTAWLPRPLPLTLPQGTYSLRMFDDRGALRRTLPLTVGSQPVRVLLAP